MNVFALILVVCTLISAIITLILFLKRPSGREPAESGNRHAGNLPLVSPRAQQHLAEQNAAKDKFLAIIAHDLRNPFHIIMNMAEILMKNIESGNHQGALKTATVLHETTLTTYGMLQNLLEWTNLRNGSLKPDMKVVETGELIRQSVKECQSLALQKNITVEQQFEEGMKVMADGQMIGTVMRNLISNAIKYSHPGSTVTVSAIKSAGAVTLQVKDAGVGMSPEEQQQLFMIDSKLSRKGTRSETGSGLGLILCQEFVHLHGDSIHVSSQPGHGSLFSFRLPAAS